VKITFRSYSHVAFVLVKSDCSLWPIQIIRDTFLTLPLNVSFGGIFLYPHHGETWQFSFYKNSLLFQDYFWWKFSSKIGIKMTCDILANPLPLPTPSVIKWHCVTRKCHVLFEWPLTDLLIFSGTSSIVSLASSRSHGDEGRHRWETGWHSVPQNLHSAIRECQVTLPHPVRTCVLRILEIITLVQTCLWMQHKYIQSLNSMIRKCQVVLPNPVFECIFHILEVQYERFKVITLGQIKKWQH